MEPQVTKKEESCIWNYFLGVLYDLYTTLMTHYIYLGHGVSSTARLVPLAMAVLKAVP